MSFGHQVTAVPTIEASRPKHQRVMAGAVEGDAGEIFVGRGAADSQRSKNGPIAASFEVNELRSFVGFCP